MDIEKHLILRSFLKPATTPMINAFIGAVVVHGLMGVGFYIESNINVAEIPEFINVKLTAGFEEVEIKKATKKKPELRKKETLIPVKKKIKKQKSAESFIQPQQVKKITKQADKATTFVAADSKPYILKNPKPVYPAKARRRGMQGVVILSVDVNEKGYVESVNVSKTSGYRLLDRSALSSVANWRFVPAKRGEKYVASKIEIPIRFILE